MTPLEHALAYAARGWRVAPVNPGTKWPRIDEWQIHATTEPATIAGWWRNTDGVSIATGIGSALVVIDIDPRHGGDESWAQLERTHGEIDTVEAVTGRGDGGRHLYFRMPTDVVITNAGAYHLPAGLDVRGEGGQVVAPPTIHPDTGQPYAWEIAHDPFDGYPLAELPGWLLDLLTRPIPEQTARAERIPYAGTDSVIDLFAANRTWPELLEAEGWQFHSRRAGDFEMWTRPGKQVKDGPSATLYYQGSDVLKVFTSEAAPLQQEATYTRFGFWAAMHHGGDHSAAARAYRREANAASDGVVGVGKGTSSSAPTPPATAERKPQIVHNGRQLDELVRQATAALIRSNTPPSLFVRAGQLSRLRQDEDERPIIEGLRAEHCRLALAEAATWWRVNKDGEQTATSPPLDVSASVLAQGEWQLPPLAGVVELPVLRPDGTFATEHGYDLPTRLFHWHRGAPYAPVSDAPATAELAAAVALIDEMLCDFPWDSSADRANAWALLLTPLIRAIVGQVPMALIDAPEPGTGKGLLVKLAAIITIGRAAGLMAWPTTDEELEKKVTAALMAGNTMLIFDNVEGIIKSPTLAAVLTADSWQGRVLGRSEMVMVPNRATWACTGNNVDVGGDLARRCYRIRLDARQAQPWKRSDFKHADLEGWTADHRGDLLHALCTIVRSWWVAGQQPATGISAMGGYTSWVRIIGGVLNHAGVPDFLGNLAEFHADADRESQAWEAFLGAWSDDVGEQTMTVAQLINRMGDSHVGHRLRDVLPEDLSGYWDTTGFSRRLSLALRKRVGRHFGGDGLHLVEMPRDRTKVAVYSVTARPMQLFAADGRGSWTSPAEHDSLTRDDASERGSAVSSPVLRHEKSYPQGENLNSRGPNNSPHSPHSRAYDPAVDEEF